LTTRYEQSLKKLADTGGFSRKKNNRPAPNEKKKKGGKLGRGKSWLSGGPEGVVDED